MEKLKTGIIGCGKVAHIHAKALQNIKESEFKAVYSRTPEKGNKFAEQYGVRAFSDITEMISQTGLETHPARQRADQTA